MKSLSRGFAYMMILSSVFFVFTAFFVPMSVHAQSAQGGGDGTGGGKWTGLTFDCGVDSSGKQQNAVNGTAVYGNCTYNDLINAVKKVLNLATTFALAFTVVVLAYAGFIYITSRGSASGRAKANKMFATVAEGIFYILAAWLIVHWILVALATTAVQQATPIQNSSQ